MLRIDPSLPLVWHSATSAHIGAQRAVVVLDDVDDAMTMALERLRRGIVPGELDVLLGTDRARALLDRLAPALEGAVRPRLTIRVMGDCAIARTLRSVLVDDGHRVRLHDEQLTVLVAPWRVPEPDRQRLLRRDAPHIPVVVGDAWIDIGPFTVPGRGPCARCVALAAPRLAPVLPAPGVVAAGTIASTVGTLAVAINLAATAALPIGAAWRVDRRTGAASRTRHAAHPACGCGAAELAA